MKMPTFTQFLCIRYSIIFFACIFFTTMSKAQFAIDLGIIDIKTPHTGCEILEDTVEVTIFNFGTTPQSLIPLTFSVNGNIANVTHPLDGFYTGVLGPDSMVTLTFEATYDFSEDGTYEIAAWTEVANDMDLSNDTFIYIVENIPVISAFPYANTFDEAFPTEWYPDTENAQYNSWEYGMPQATDIDTAFTGEYAYVTNLTGNYNNAELSYLVSPCMDFSNFSEDPTFRCAIYYETEQNYDGAWLEGSTDDGLTWSKIGTVGTGTNWYNFNNTTQGLFDVWAGDSEGWLIAENILEGYAGEPVVRLRFVFDSDGSVTYEGIAIDDISIEGCLLSFHADFDIIHASSPTAGDGEVTVIPNEGLPPFSYEWSTGATTATLTGLEMGDYTLTITDALGCTEVVTVTIGISSSAQEADAIQTLRLYPNPTHDGWATLDLELVEAQDIEIVVLNPIGGKVLSFSKSNAKHLSQGIDLRHLSSGLYFVQITIDGKERVLSKLLHLEK